MQKLILYIGLTFLVVGCKGEQRVAFEASNVFSSKGVEIPVYDFENF